MTLVRRYRVPLVVYPSRIVTRSQADQWIIASAVVTGGTYTYLRWRGAKDAAPVPVFVTAWGVVYVTLSIMALASPGVAAGFAILVLTADMLSNLPDLADEIARIEGTATQQPRRPQTRVQTRGVHTP